MRFELCRVKRVANERSSYISAAAATTTAAAAASSSPVIGSANGNRSNSRRCGRDKEEFGLSLLVRAVVFLIGCAISLFETAADMTCNSRIANELKFVRKRVMLGEKFGQKPSSNSLERTRKRRRRKRKMAQFEGLLGTN